MLAWAAPAAAQLSSAQQSALRSNCRSDFMSKCSGVKPGGQEALTCLQQNVASLSAACKTAVGATMPHSEAAPAAPPPAAAAPPPPAPPKATVAKPPAKPAKPAAAAPVAPAAPTAAQQSAMRSACRSDFMSHCSGVSPGGKEALACLQRNVGALSPSCKKVVSSTMAARPAAAVAPVAAPPPAGAVAVGPTPEQMKALKFTCRADFGRHCKGIPPGPEAFVCLQAHLPRLSPNCRTSVAAIADEMPAGAMPAAVAPAAPPPVVVARPTPVDAVVMLRACKLDLLRHCRGVEPGGGRELACLAAHEARLSVRCKMARRVTAPLH
jgi:hypothetical protein